MYQQVIFSNSLLIVSAKVFKFLHFDATFVSSAKATLKSEKFVRSGPNHGLKLSSLAFNKLLVFIFNHRLIVNRDQKQKYEKYLHLIKSAKKCQNRPWIF